MAIAIGLDFGTTNSVVTYADGSGKLKTYRGAGGSPLIPSAIYFKTKDDYVIGNAALNLSAKNSAAIILGFKTKLNKDDMPYLLTLDDGSKLKIVPRKVVQLFLNKLLRQVQDYLFKKLKVDATIDRAVITVPTKFTDAANRAIKFAAAKAMQLDVQQVKLVYEPTAAAVAALTDDDSESARLLIYDFGGGTFDVSLMYRENGVFKQIKTDGDPDCGGDLLTKILARNLLEWANDEYGTNFPWDDLDFDEKFNRISEDKYRANKFAITREANRAKIILSEEHETEAAFQFWTNDDDSNQYFVAVSRRDFENMIRAKINHTAEITRRVVESAEAQALGGIDKIIIAGGSGQIPMIRAVLKSKLGSLPINQSGDVSTLISRGAAMLAKDIDTLEQVIAQKTTVQLGISSTDGMNYGKFQTIIDEGLNLPCESSCDFRLMKDGQRLLKLSYYERDLKNYPNASQIDDDGVAQVDELEIELPPNLSKADTIVRVTFTVQKDSSLGLSAKVLRNDGQTVGEETIRVSRVSDLF